MKYVIISGILINFSIASNNSTNIIEPNKINNTTNKKKEKIYIEYAIAKKNEISIVLYGVKKSLINKIIDISLNIIGSITFIPLMIYFLTNESSSKISNDNNIFSIFFNNFFLVIYSIKKDIFTINNSKILAIILLLTNIILMLLPYLSTKLINIKKNKNYNIYYQKLNINESNLFLIVTYINVILLYLIFIFFPIIWLNFISMNRNRNSILLSFFMLVLYIANIFSLLPSLSPSMYLKIINYSFIKNHPLPLSSLDIPIMENNQRKKINDQFEIIPIKK